MKKINKEILQRNVKEYELMKQEETKREIERKMVNEERYYERFKINEKENIQAIELQMLKVSKRGRNKYKTVIIEDTNLLYSRIRMYQRYFEESGFKVNIKLAFKTRKSIFDLCDSIIGYDIEIKW
jgi:Ni,Fe-hydrogenase III large subunit